MAGPSKLVGALNAQEFRDAVAHFPKLSERARSVARAVLVQGKTFEHVVDAHDITRQQAHAWATKIHELHQRGWVTRTVTLPTAQMRKVLQMEAAARARRRGRASSATPSPV